MNDELQELIQKARNGLRSVQPPPGSIRTVLAALAAQLKVTEDAIGTKGAGITPTEIAGFKAELVSLAAAIDEVVKDGPTESTNEMFKSYASNARIFLVSLWAIIGVSVMIGLVVCCVGEKARLPAEITSILPLVAIMGALGGFLTCMQSIGLYIGNRQFLRSWTIYYLLFPLKGSGLALVVFFLINTQLGEQFASESLSPSGGETNVVSGMHSPAAEASQTNVPAGAAKLVLGTNAANSVQAGNTAAAKAAPAHRVRSAEPAKGPINVAWAALLAALTGMFANQAIEMLATIFSVIFRKVEGRDPHTTTDRGARPVGKT